MKRMVWTSQAVCLLGLMMLVGCTSTMPASTSPHSARHKSGPCHDSSLAEATPGAGTDHRHTELSD